jgi:hypothetical protein
MKSLNLYLLYLSDVMSLVASSCGYYGGHIEHRAAYPFVVHVATQRARAQRRQHRHPPRAQPIASRREHHGRGPRLPPKRGTEQALHRAQGLPGGDTREEQRRHRFSFLGM